MRTLLAILAACGLALEAQTPQITSFVSAADFAPGVAVEGLATIYGSHFSIGKFWGYTIPLPTKLENTELLACGYPVVLTKCAPLPLIYLSPTQINFQAPPDTASLPLPNAALLVRRNGQPSTDAAATAAAKLARFEKVAPRIFWMGYDCPFDPLIEDAGRGCGVTTLKNIYTQVRRGAVTDVAGNLVTSAYPAKVGQYYTIWMTGLGALEDGALAAPVSLRLGNITIYQSTSTVSIDYGKPDYAGPSQFGGLYQINFKLPDIGKVAGFPPQLPCGSYRWELNIDVSISGQRANVVQLPVSYVSRDSFCLN